MTRSGDASLDAVVRALRHAGLFIGTERDPLPAAFTSVTDDSRSVRDGALFVAVRGSVIDGHDFLDAAASGGAAAAIVEDSSRTSLPAIVVRDARRAAAIAAAVAWGEPGRELSLIGVTGTNGKTTTVGMLRHLLDKPDLPAASVGTLGVLVGSAGRVLPGGRGLTTPGPVEMQRVLRALADAGVRRVAIEASSHSLEQQRVEGLSFAAAVFTNVTRDHLDYHGSMEAYVAAKALLVRHLAPGGVAVVNADDPAWAALPAAPRTVRFGISSPGLDVTAGDVAYGPDGSRWFLVAGGERAAVQLPLIGEFNIVNALGAAAAAWATGMSVAAIAGRLSCMPQVTGRFERLLDRPTVLRDYAHTPDALQRALGALRPFVPPGGRLVVVFGCGGDRDRGKRPQMGAIAERLSDLAIVTSDNPRTEDPECILDDIEAGMAGGRHERIEDRRRAIARALEIAGDRDVVLLAGKGHETYQIRGTISFPFDEGEIVRDLAASGAAGAGAGGGVA